MPCFVSTSLGTRFLSRLGQHVRHPSVEQQPCHLQMCCASNSIVTVPVSRLVRSGATPNFPRLRNGMRRRRGTAVSDTLLYQDRIKYESGASLIQEAELVEVAGTVLEPNSAPVQRTRKSKRKPHGYWNDLENVQRELLLVNASLGRRGRKQMPRLAEMKALGRGDLVAALAKYGGSKKVAAVLRWGPYKKSGLKLPSSIRTHSKLPYTELRPKETRRTADYWKDLGRVQLEVTLFIRQHCVPDGVMPTQAHFRSLGRADIVNGLAKHGGLRSVAASMNLRCARSRATIRFDFQSFASQVLLFSKSHCPGKMPTAEELKKHGSYKIANAVVVHGGYPSVARRLNLELRSTRVQKPTNVWNLERLSKELRLFLNTEYPESDCDCMPTERQLRSKGRNDLSYAIGMLGSMNGGKKRLASLLDLKLKKARSALGKRPPNWNNKA